MLFEDAVLAGGSDIFGEEGAIGSISSAGDDELEEASRDLSWRESTW